MKTKFFSLLLLLTLTISFSACNDNEGDVQFVPVQESEGGNWSMIGPDGKLLFSEEFKREPTIVVNDRFMVKNQKGMWEIYTAQEKPERIGKEYRYATSFDDNGRALVAEVNHHVTIIDKDGKEIKVLDKVDGKTVLGVNAFSENYAVVACGNKNEKYTSFGVIDDDGKVVIEPKYAFITDCNDGKFLAVKKTFQDQVDRGHTDSIDVEVLDQAGKSLFTLKHTRYCNDKLNMGFQNGMLAVCVKKNGDNCWGIINDKGEEVVKPQAKIKGIGKIGKDCFVYNNGEGNGLMNLKGEVMVRAKYESLGLIDDDGDRLLARTDKDGKSQLKMIDKDGNEITQDDYEGYIAFPVGKNLLIQESDKAWTMIDPDGKELEKLPDIVNVGFNYGDVTVIDDYVNFDELISSLSLTVNGVDSLSFSTTPQEFLKRIARLGYDNGDANHSHNDPYWYDGTSSSTYTHSLDGVDAKIEVDFSGNLSHQTYTTKSEPYYYDEWSGTTYYYNYEVPSGYVFNQVHPTQFGVTITNDGKMKGKLRMLLDALKSWGAKNGTLFTQNDGAGIYNLKSGHKLAVFMQSTKVVIILGDFTDIDISQFADAKEDSAPDTDTDTAVVEAAPADSVAADTAMAVPY